MSASYKVTLLRREVVARDTISVAFSKPEGFTFKAGQAIDLTLLDPPEKDDKGTGRAFSIVSAPYQDEIAIATRARDSAFKRTLRTMPVGAPIQLDGPTGSLTLHGNRSRTAIILAGGIGITPFMSIIRQAQHEKLAQAIELLYSNRRPEDAAFLAELQERQQTGPLRLTAVMTDVPAGGGWKSRIDAELVRTVAARAPAPVFYTAGPPAMVGAMRELLAGLGVQDDDIKSEDFAGY